MNALSAIVLGVVERGLIYTLIVCGIYVTSRIIRFDDLSVEGSVGLGGAVTAACLANGINSWLSLGAVIVAGTGTGLATGLLHTRLGLNNLISGIIVSTALFSVCLKIGSSTTVLPADSSLFACVPYSLMLLLPISCTIICTLVWLLKTDVGFLLRAVGENPRMLQNLGKSVDKYKIIGLVIANVFNALGGAFLAHYMGYFSIWSNVGILVIGLTSLIIAELMNKKCGVNLMIGAVVYQGIIATTFELNIDQDWNKCITAVLLVILLAVHKKVSKG
jgi:putative ABC transport system permease protein